MTPLDSLLFFASDLGEERIKAAVLLLVVATFVSLLARRLRIPYTIGLVLMGLALGLMPQLAELRVPADIILLVFLPPILFEGTLAMDIGMLSANWREVSLLALAVTMGTFVGLGAFAHFVLGWPWVLALLIGAILSATDPVSVLALMREVGAPRRLSLLLESESCFNDGIGVVLFGVVVTALRGQEVSLLGALTLFLKEGVGGLALGAVLAYGVCQLLRRVDDPLTETMLSLGLAYSVYIAAEAVHVSGIMAVIAAGLVVGNLAIPHVLSVHSRVVLRDAWELLAFLANSVLFLFMGVALQHGNLGQMALASVAIFGAMLVLRQTLVYALVGRLLSWPWLHVLGWGGVRGSIPLALALGLPAFSVDGGPSRAEVVSLVYNVVLGSLVVQGLTVGPLMGWLGVRRAHPAEEEYECFLARRVALQAVRQRLVELLASGQMGRPLHDELNTANETELAALEADLTRFLEAHPGVVEARRDEIGRSLHLAQRAAVDRLMQTGIIGPKAWSDVRDRLVEREKAEE